MIYKTKLDLVDRIACTKYIADMVFKDGLYGPAYMKLAEINAFSIFYLDEYGLDDEIADMELYEKLSKDEEFKKTFCRAILDNNCDFSEVIEESKDIIEYRKRSYSPLNKLIQHLDVIAEELGSKFKDVDISKLEDICKVIKENADK